MRMTRILFVLAIFAAALSPLVGCNGNDDGGNGGDPKVLDVRDGYWRIQTTLTATGDPEQCAGSATEIDTSLICEIDFSDSDQTPFTVTCEVTSDASTFSFDCGGAFTLSPCTILFTNIGSGTYTETTLEFTSTTRITSTGPDNPCLQYADPCTTLAAVTATWLSPDTTGTCAQAKPVSVESFVRTGVARVLGME